MSFKNIKQLLEKLTSLKYIEMSISESSLKDLYKRSGVDWEVGSYKDGKSYCCYDDKKLVGHCWVLDDGTIFNVVVDKEYRGQGVASKLLQQAIKGGGKYLAAVKSNVKFYTDRGFKVYFVEYSEDFGEDLYYLELK